MMAESTLTDPFVFLSKQEIRPNETPNDDDNAHAGITLTNLADVQWTIIDDLSQGLQFNP